MGLFEGEPDICEEGGSGLILPIFPGEQQLYKPARAFLYFMVLSWCFIGVAIIADIFMAAIEAVTSQRKDWRLRNGQVITVKVWNDTVANLTLMALGSSAPEILLNVLEIIGEDFYSGELGPSTIVGSAAFNLMVIIAVCVLVIPDGESRTISHPEPFFITAFFSVFAYIWLVIILSCSSPDRVTPAEGVITFLFFPLLVLVAWLADVGILSSRKVEEEDHDLVQQKILEAGYSLTQEEVKKLARLKTAEMDSSQKSYAQYRCEVGTFGYGKSISPKDLCVGFLSARYCFHNGMKALLLEVEKTGENPNQVMETRVGFEYSTRDGTMRHEDGHYQAANGFGEIPAGQQYGEILIQRKPGDLESELAVDGFKQSGTEPDAPYFYVELVHVCKLAVPSAGNALRRLNTGDTDQIKDLTNQTPIPILPEHRRTQVVIDDRQGAGQLRFHQPEMDVPAPELDTAVRIKVRRMNGTQGEVGCHFATESDTAKAGLDFQHTEGDLLFPAGVAELNIDVTIYKKTPGRVRNLFYVIIGEIPGRSPVIADDYSVCTVTIHEGKSLVGTSHKVLNVLQSGLVMDSLLQGGKDWADQFSAALRPGNGDEADKEQATMGDWTLHAITLPWKLLFALTPPTSYCNGWATFFVGLGFIGLITGLIGDLARLMGCCMLVSDQITAITFVALGTSLPDTFASKVAAVQDPTADAAIGNVTGSNSVNVFLGLGLPWMMASIKWAIRGPNDLWRRRYPEQSKVYPEGGFIVIAGDLTFSVVIFSICCVAVLATLLFRRATFQAELGGPLGVKTNTSIFFVMLWLFYISLASWKVVQGDNVPAGKLVVAVLVGLCVVVLGMISVSTMLYCWQSMRQSRKEEMREVIEEMHHLHEDLTKMQADMNGFHIGGRCSVLKSATPGAFSSEASGRRSSATFLPAASAPFFTAGSLLNGNRRYQPLKERVPLTRHLSILQNGYHGQGNGTVMPTLVGASRPSMLLPNDGDNPQSERGSDIAELHMAEAVANLREHIEAMNTVCCAMESQLARQDGSGDAPRTHVKLKKICTSKKSRVKKGVSQSAEAVENSPVAKIGHTVSCGPAGTGGDKE